MITRHVLWAERTTDDCCYCQEPMSPPALHWQAKSSTMATLEHLLPLSRGGTRERSNLALACSRCNYVKGNLTVEEFETAVAFMVTNNIPLGWNGINYRSISTTPLVAEYLGLPIGGPAKVKAGRRATVVAPRPPVVEPSEPYLRQRREAAERKMKRQDRELAIAMSQRVQNAALKLARAAERQAARAEARAA